MPPTNPARSTAAAASSSNTLNFNPPTTIPVRTEEYQQLNSKALAARAARRQSLGNRRVSFAPEATLHTWDVVEYYGDATPSSASGSNSTGRLSTIEATPTPTTSTSAPESPKLPDNTTAFAPETPLERKGGGSGGGGGGGGFHSPAASTDTGFSSPFSSDAGGSPFADLPEAASDSDSMSDDDDDEDGANERTFMTNVGDMTMDMDADEMTGVFGVFGKRTTWKLEGATEPVDPDDEDTARTAAPREIEEQHDGGEMTMEMTRAVGGLLHPAPASYPALPTHLSSDTEDDGEMTMEMTRAIGGLLPAATDMFVNPYDTEQQEDVTADMDMTRPVGGILASAANLLQGARKSLGFFSGASPQPQPQPQLQLQRQQNQSADNVMDMDIEMDMTIAVGGILANQPPRSQRPLLSSSPIQHGADMTMDMDMTVAIGGILPAPSTRFAASPELSDDDMDMTIVVGGIQSARTTRFAASPEESEDENEGMTMEFTSVLGGILGRAPTEKEPAKKRRSSLAKNSGGGRLMSADAWKREQDAARNEEEEEEMEMTISVGGILDRQQADEDDEDSEVDMDGVTMDVTTAIGRILPPRPAAATGRAGARSPAKIPAPKGEAENVGRPTPTPAKRRASGRRSIGMAATGEPRVTRRSSAIRRSLEAQQQESAPSASKIQVQVEIPVRRVETPVQKVQIPAQKVQTPRQKATPSNQTKKATPKETADTIFVFATPQRKLVNSLQPQTPPNQATPIVKPKTPSKFAPLIETPLRLATPQHHGFSLSAKKALGFPTSPSPFKFAGASQSGTRGVGIDKPGLGSPRVAAKLSARKSISESSIPFSPIAAPRDLLRASLEDDAADREEERREKQKEVERRKSLDLRSRIELLTPRKAGRKSLAYGALLQGHGKREREEDASTFLGGGKRRKSLEFGLLAQPLSPARATRSMELDKAPSLQTPKKHTLKKPSPQKKSVTIAPISVASSPMAPPPKPIPVVIEVDSEEEESFEEEEEPKLTLQQFLSMTSISFLDGLTTTKRRATGFPGLELRRGRRNTDGEEEAEVSLAECVIAGACTNLMFGLFQHSCRELKKYIQEGREVVKEIESDTLDDNPLLFREYIDAPPDVKVIMDTQFKNVKTHARLLAKGIWYEWRMKLLDGVKTALDENLVCMKADEAVIEEAENVTKHVMPGLMARFEAATKTVARMDEVKKRIESDDKEQLREARDRLKSVREKIEEVKKKLERRRKEVEELDIGIEAQEKQKAILQESIGEAERVKEMNRGWSEDEIAGWKNKVSALERKFGWSIAMVHGTVVELVFLKQLRVFCDATGVANTRVEYLAPVTIKSSDPAPLQDAEHSFFTACLNARLSNITTTKPTLKTTLAEINTFWRRCLTTSDEIRKVRKMYPITLTPHGENELRVAIKVLVPEIRSKVVIEVLVDKEMAVKGGAKVIYGGVNEALVSEFVGNALKEGKEGVWRGVVESLVGRCLEGKRKGGVGVPTKA